MDKACSPTAERRSSKIFSGNPFKKFKTLWILVCVTAVLLSVTLQNYTVNQYARAVFKLIIMQLIDLNNFKNLLRDSCLIHKEIPKNELIKSDCYTCESIDRVDVIRNPEEMLESYAELDWPVTYKSDIRTNVSVEDVALALLTGDFLPCDYESNLKFDPLRAIEIKSGWFMHWRNCDDIRGKIIRSLYRPDLFLSVSSETWTIMSFKYNTVHYKIINMDFDGKVAVSQINGTLHYQLMPKKPCGEICKPLYGRLDTYRILIFNSFIWDFRYLPTNNSTTSIAIIFYLD